MQRIFDYFILLFVVYFKMWWPYIDLNHPNEENWHILIDVFVLDTTNGLVELLIAMINLNK
jgi:hypothetical protein